MKNKKNILNQLAFIYLISISFDSSACGCACGVDFQYDTGALQATVIQESSTIQLGMTEGFSTLGITVMKSSSGVASTVREATESQILADGARSDLEAKRKEAIDDFNKIQTLQSAAVHTQNTCAAKSVATSQAQIAVASKGLNGAMGKITQEPKEKVNSTGGYQIGDLNDWCSKYGTEEDLKNKKCTVMGNKITLIDKPTTINAGQLANNIIMKPGQTVGQPANNLDPSNETDAATIDAKKELAQSISGSNPPKQLTKNAAATPQGNIYNSMSNSYIRNSSLAAQPFLENVADTTALVTSAGVAAALSYSSIGGSSMPNPDKISKDKMLESMILEQKVYNPEWFVALSAATDPVLLAKDQLVTSSVTNQLLLEIYHKITLQNQILASQMAILNQVYMEPKLKAQAAEADEAARRTAGN
jgi:hypothetical protein